MSWLRFIINFRKSNWQKYSIFPKNLENYCLHDDNVVYNLSNLKSFSYFKTKPEYCRNMSKHVLLIVLILSTFLSATEESSLKRAIFRLQCMENCQICGELYGSFFQIGLCKRTCDATMGRLDVDCGDILSIAPFLSRTAAFQMQT